MRASSPIRIRFSRLFALFFLVALAELALLVWIGGQIGFWPTLGLVTVTALVGSSLARREGLAVLARLQGRLAKGAVPGRELTDGLIILVSGVLLLTPGVLTDAAGLLGLFPPTRAWIRPRLEARFRRWIEEGRVRAFNPAAPFSPPPSSPPPTEPSAFSPPPEEIEDARILYEE